MASMAQLGVCSPNPNPNPNPNSHVAWDEAFPLVASMAQLGVCSPNPNPNPNPNSHVAWDEAFPLVASMAQLGVYSSRLRLLRTHGCDVLEAASCAPNPSLNPNPSLGPITLALLRCPGGCELCA